MMARHNGRRHTGESSVLSSGDSKVYPSEGDQVAEQVAVGKTSPLPHTPPAAPNRLWHTPRGRPTETADSGRRLSMTAVDSQAGEPLGGLGWAESLWVLMHHNVCCVGAAYYVFFIPYDCAWGGVNQGGGQYPTSSRRPTALMSVIFDVLFFVDSLIRLMRPNMWARLHRQALPHVGGMTPEDYGRPPIVASISDALVAVECVSVIPVDIVVGLVGTPEFLM